MSSRLIEKSSEPSFKASLTASSKLTPASIAILQIEHDFGRDILISCITIHYTHTALNQELGRKAGLVIA